MPWKYLGAELGALECPYCSEPTAFSVDRVLSNVYQCPCGKRFTHCTDSIGSGPDGSVAVLAICEETLEHLYALWPVSAVPDGLIYRPPTPTQPGIFLYEKSKLVIPYKYARSLFILSGMLYAQVGIIATAWTGDENPERIAAFNKFGLRNDFSSGSILESVHAAVMIRAEEDRLRKKCSKMSYDSSGDAARAIKGWNNREGKKRVQFYRCSHCEKWHLTSQPTPSKIGSKTRRLDRDEGE